MDGHKENKYKHSVGLPHITEIGPVCLEKHEGSRKRNEKEGLVPLVN